MATFRSEDIPDLQNQVILVTGGTAGLGLESIRQLSLHTPARIYLAARSQKKAAKAIAELQEANPEGSPIEFLELDLASFDSIKSAAAHILERETRLDILMNNAGIMMTAPELSRDGYEIQFGTNVMGPALLTQLLLPLMRATARLNPQTRVVMLSSATHARAPKDLYKFNELLSTAASVHTTDRYATSKLANIHYAKALAEREKEVKIIPVHPGMVATNLHHGSNGLFLRRFLFTAIKMFATPVQQGALSQIWASVSPDAESGQYYGPVGKPETGSKLCQDEEVQNGLFNWIQSQLEGHVSQV